MDNVTALTGGPVRPGSSRAGRPRRRSMIGRGATGLLVLLVLSACDAGQQAETSRETPSVAGVDGAVGTMVLDDVFIDSRGTVAAGASVPLRGAFTNQALTADQLVSVSTPAAGSVELLDAEGTPSTQGISIPADGQVNALNGPALLRLVDVNSPIATTQLVPVTFVFAAAGSVQLDIPVATAGTPAVSTDPSSVLAPP